MVNKKHKQKSTSSKNIKKKLPILAKEEVKKLSTETRILEALMDSFGMPIRVVEIISLNNYTDFYVDVSLGTKLSELMKYDKDMAMALASPTGKVEIIAPVPGRALVKIRLPLANKKKTKNQKYKIIKIKESTDKEKGWVHWMFKLMAVFFSWVSRKMFEMSQKTSEWFT